MKSVTLLVALFGFFCVASAATYTQFSLTSYTFNRHSPNAKACAGNGYPAGIVNVGDCINNLVHNFAAIKIFFNTQANEYYIEDYTDKACTQPYQSYPYTTCFGNGYQGLHYTMAPLDNSSVPANGCSAEYIVTQRPETYVSDGVRYYFYDIGVKNTGSLAVTAASLTISLTGTVASSWNYNFGTHSVSGFEGSITPSSTYNGAGFIFSESTPKFPTSSVTCGTVQGATTVTYNPAPPTTGTCSVSATITARAGASNSATIWDVVITNTGDQKVRSLALVIPTANSAVDGSVSNTWNLRPIIGDFYNYDVLMYSDLNVGSSYTGAGFIITGTTKAPSVFTQYVTCGN